MPSRRVNPTTTTRPRARRLGHHQTASREGALAAPRRFLPAGKHASTLQAAGECFCPFHACCRASAECSPRSAHCAGPPHSEYYIDHARGVTQWTLPAGGGPAPSPPSSSGAYSLPPSSSFASGGGSGYQLPQQQNGARPSGELTAADLAAIAAIEEADAREEEQRRLARERDASVGGASLFGGGDSEEADGDGEPRAHEWVANKDATSCFLTGVKFTLTNRRHHCRYWCVPRCPRTALPNVGPPPAPLTPRCAVPRRARLPAPRLFFPCAAASA